MVVGGGLRECSEGEVLSGSVAKTVNGNDFSADDRHRGPSPRLHQHRGALSELAVQPPTTRVPHDVDHALGMFGGAPHVGAVVHCAAGPRHFVSAGRHAAD